MADKKKKDNIFKRTIKGIVRRFTEVRQELKRVIWPTKEKLIQVSVVVLAVIVAAAVFLSLIGKGTGFILEKAGFYRQVEETTATTTTAAETTAEATAAETTAA